MPMQKLVVSWTPKAQRFRDFLSLFSWFCFFVLVDCQLTYIKFGDSSCWWFIILFTTKNPGRKGFLMLGRCKRNHTTQVLVLICIQAIWIWCPGLCSFLKERRSTRPYTGLFTTGFTRASWSCKKDIENVFGHHHHPKRTYHLEVLVTLLSGALCWAISLDFPHTENKKPTKLLCRRNFLTSQFFSSFSSFPPFSIRGERRWMQFPRLFVCGGHDKPGSWYNSGRFPPSCLTNVVYINLCVEFHHFSRCTEFSILRWFAENFPPKMVTSTYPKTHSHSVSPYHYFSKNPRFFLEILVTLKNHVFFIKKKCPNKIRSRFSQGVACLGDQPWEAPNWSSSTLVARVENGDFPACYVIVTIVFLGCIVELGKYDPKQLRIFCDCLFDIGSNIYRFKISTILMQCVCVCIHHKWCALQIR